MKTTDIDFIYNNDINLCDSCRTEVPVCMNDGIEIVIGDNKDNVASCNAYQPMELRHPKWEGHGQI